jgi:hypothetical protein
MRNCAPGSITEQEVGRLIEAANPFAQAVCLAIVLAWVLF